MYNLLGKVRLLLYVNITEVVEYGVEGNRLDSGGQLGGDVNSYAIAMFVSVLGRSRSVYISNTLGKY